MQLQGELPLCGSYTSSSTNGGIGTANITVNNSNVLVRGTGGDDNFTINSVSNDQIYGLTGNDSFSGQISSSQVYGGGGNDSRRAAHLPLSQAKSKLVPAPRVPSRTLRTIG